MHNHVPPEGGFHTTSEAARFQLAQAGCRSCLNWLMRRHDGLVQHIVRRQALGDLAFGSALQAGRIGLWRAIQGYDPQRGYAFSSYAWPAIARQVWRAVKKAERAAPSPGLPATTPTTDETDPAVLWQASVVQQALHHLVQSLPARLRYVVVTRYGLDDASPATYRQIGVALGFSDERARQLHIEALVWLRHPAHSYALRSLLGRHTLADYQAADLLAQRWLRWRGGHHGR